MRSSSRRPPSPRCRGPAVAFIPRVRSRTRSTYTPRNSLSQRQRCCLTTAPAAIPLLPVSRLSPAARCCPGRRAAAARPPDPHQGRIQRGCLSRCSARRPDSGPKTRRPRLGSPGWGLPRPGGAAGTRTPDPRRAKAVLSQPELRPQTPRPARPRRAAPPVAADALPGGGRAWTRTRGLGLIRAAL